MDGCAWVELSSMLHGESAMHAVAMVTSESLAVTDRQGALEIGSQSVPFSGIDH